MAQDQQPTPQAPGLTSTAPRRSLPRPVSKYVDVGRIKVLDCPDVRDHPMFRDVPEHEIAAAVRSSVQAESEKRLPYEPRVGTPARVGSIEENHWQAKGEEGPGPSSKTVTTSSSTAPNGCRDVANGHSTISPTQIPKPEVLKAGHTTLLSRRTPPPSKLRPTNTFFARFSTSSASKGSCSESRRSFVPRLIGENKKTKAHASTQDSGRRVSSPFERPRTRTGWMDQSHITHRTHPLTGRYSTRLAARGLGSRFDPTIDGTSGARDTRFRHRGSNRTSVADSVRLAAFNPDEARRDFMLNAKGSRLDYREGWKNGVRWKIYLRCLHNFLRRGVRAFGVRRAEADADGQLMDCDRAALPTEAKSNIPAPAASGGIQRERALVPLCLRPSTRQVDLQGRLVYGVDSNGNLDIKGKGRQMEETLEVAEVQDSDYTYNGPIPSPRSSYVPTRPSLMSVTPSHRSHRDGWNPFNLPTPDKDLALFKDNELLPWLVHTKPRRVRAGSLARQKQSTLTTPTLLSLSPRSVGERDQMPSVAKGDRNADESATDDSDRDRDEDKTKYVAASLAPTTPSGVFRSEIVEFIRTHPVCPLVPPPKSPLRKMQKALVGNSVEQDIRDVKNGISHKVNLASSRPGSLTSNAEDRKDSAIDVDGGCKNCASCPSKFDGVKGKGKGKGALFEDIEDLKVIPAGAGAGAGAAHHINSGREKQTHRNGDGDGEESAHGCAAVIQIGNRTSATWNLADGQWRRGPKRRPSSIPTPIRAHASVGRAREHSSVGKASDANGNVSVRNSVSGTEWYGSGRRTVAILEHNKKKGAETEKQKKTEQNEQEYKML